MPFTLNVTFAGMCLLVNDTRDRVLRVALPPTGHGSGHGGDVARHIARLIYDRSLEREGGTPSHEPRHVPLERVSLDLTGLATDDRFDPTMPRAVVDLAEAAPQRVSRSAVEGEVGGRVLARVTFDRGRVTWQHRGGVWRLGAGEPRHMSIAVRWTVAEVQRDSLELPLAGPGAVGRDPTTLFPGRDGTIDLYVFHAPTDEIPQRLPPSYMGGKDPQPGDEAKHFGAFYDLIDGLGETPPLPVFVGRQMEESGEKAMLGSLITCITATATI